MTRFCVVLSSLFLFALFSCHRNPYASTNKSYNKQVKQYARLLRSRPVFSGSDSLKPPLWVGTTNFNMRKPNIVVIHHTAQNSCEQTLKTFTLPERQVSAHYVICKNGIIHYMLNDYLRAWHGGAGRWGNITDVNSSSIGIELDNNGYENFSESQINSLLRLLDTLKHRYSIPQANFIGHAEIAPTRKNDPNVTFPWQQLAKKGFGLWYSDTSSITVPDNFNSIQALRIIGYDVKDSSAAMLAFKRHFLSDTTKTALTDAGKKALFDLYQKY